MQNYDDDDYPPPGAGGSSSGAGAPIPKLTMKIKTASWAPSTPSHLPAPNELHSDPASSEYEDYYPPHLNPPAATLPAPQKRSYHRNKRITSFIADKQLRLRSYLRRRPIPFKRTQEIDAQIGCKSRIIQICRDFEECLYWGHPELVKYFLRDEGLKFTDTEAIVKTRGSIKIHVYVYFSQDYSIIHNVYSLNFSCSLPFSKPFGSSPE